MILRNMKYLCLHCAPLESQAAFSDVSYGGPDLRDDQRLGSLTTLQMKSCLAVSQHLPALDFQNHGTKIIHCS